MIEVTFLKKNDNIVSVQLTGHAESGPYGHDIVCAAVSALSIGTVNSLTQIAEVDLDISSDDEEGGYLLFSLPDTVTLEQMETAQILLKSLSLSLESTEQEYGSYIKLYYSSKK